jgi:hypothetical protein
MIAHSYTDSAATLYNRIEATEQARRLPQAMVRYGSVLTAQPALISCSSAAYATMALEVVVGKADVHSA